MARFENVADVSFMDDISIAGLKSAAVDKWREAYEELTGTDTYPRDEIKAILYAFAQLVFQVAEVMNEAGRQNLLKYATGEYLDNLGLNYGLTRKEAEQAVVYITFTLSAVQTRAVGIAKGTQVTSESAEIYFETTEYAEVPAGEMSVSVLCRAVEGGSAANNFDAGELNVLVNPIAYVESVSNDAAPQGGTDTESDDDFAERIYESRYLYSTTGSEAAYIYFTKSVSSLIKDVAVCCEPGTADIEIYILLYESDEPDPDEAYPTASAALLAEIQDYLNQSEIRALTDNVTVHNANIIEYEISLEYYIDETDAANITEIQAAVETAVDEYIEWQDGKFGRDIDPQELLARVVMAGGRSVTADVTGSAGNTVQATEAAYCTGKTIEYLGLKEL